MRTRQPFAVSTRWRIARQGLLLASSSPGMRRRYGGIPGSCRWPRAWACSTTGARAANGRTSAPARSQSWTAAPPRRSPIPLLDHLADDGDGDLPGGLAAEVEADGGVQAGELGLADAVHLQPQ